MFTPGTVCLPSEEDTARLAARIAPHFSPGDTLLFEGPIGSGKSTFCRALIRCFCGADTEVPSPTFTLVQTYDTPNFEIWHCDLYRLATPEDLLELGLDDAFENALTLIEWPDRLGDLLPLDALHIELSAKPDHHRITLQSTSDRWNKLAGVLND